MSWPSSPPAAGPPAATTGRFAYLPAGMFAGGAGLSPPAATRHVPGFVLFLILNAIYFIRPSEIIPALEGWHLYLVATALCLVVSFPYLLQQVTGRTLAYQPITVCVLGLLVTGLLSLVFNLDFAGLTTSGQEFAKKVVYFLLLVTVVNSMGRLRVFLGFLVVFFFAMAALAVLEYHGYVQIPRLTVLQDLEWDPVLGRDVPILRLRGTGAFADPNDLSLVLVAGALLSLYWAGERRLGALRLLAVGSLLFFGYGLGLTQSRGGFLALVVGVVVLLTARFGLRRSLLLAGVVLPLLFVFFAGRQTSLSATGSTGQTRIQLWSDGLMFFRESPLFGIGMDQYKQRPETGGLVAHNSFLHAFAEMGFFGGMFFLGAFVLAVWSLYRLGPGRAVIPDPQARRLRPYLLAVVAAYVTSLLTLTECYLVLTYTVLGLAAVYPRVVAAYPPLRVRFGPGLVKRLALFSVAFLATLYVFVRVFIHWG